MSNTSVNEVINEFDQLPSADKEYVAEIIRKQVIELKRGKLAQRAQDAKKNFSKRLVKSGGIKELLEDLESD
jgi:Arc/MetJ family transcription regulator